MVANKNFKQSFNLIVVRYCMKVMILLSHQHWGKRSHGLSAHSVCFLSSGVREDSGWVHTVCTEIRRWMPYYGSFESYKNSGGKRTLMILKVALTLLISFTVVVQVNGFIYTSCKSWLKFDITLEGQVWNSYNILN